MDRPKKVRVQFSVTQDVVDMMRELQTDPLYTEAQWFTLLIRRLHAQHTNDQRTTQQLPETQKQPPEAALPGYALPDTPPTNNHTTTGDTKTTRLASHYTSGDELATKLGWNLDEEDD